ncbi:MAG: hypothetical protein EA385_00510 [Salinarimonadaceae bacterium]|nr:MAG: hypothetical protein EA385_00510 [Salinarimonadaceae bacterium]
MRLILVDPPEAEPVTLDELKDQLRVIGDHDDAFLERAIRTARAKLDGREGFLGRALVAQQWRLELDAFPAREILLPLPPLLSVDAIVYVDAGGSEITLDASAYVAIGAGDTERGCVRRANGESWPATGSYPGAVAVTFTAGYGEPEDVPEPLRAAILMHAAHLYENREAASVERVHEVPLGWFDHVADYREPPL